MNKHLQIFLLGLFTALCFSAFIYLAEFNITIKFLNTLLGLGALGLLLYIPKQSIPVAGFWIGIFWFYWIGYSFEYQGVGYMTPIVTLGFGIIYLLFFLPLYFTQKPYIRALLLFGLSFIEPFDWNWLQIELLFVDSYIGVYKYQLFFLLAALSLPSLIQRREYKSLPFLLLLVAVNYGYPEQKDAPLKIKLVATDIPQSEKWKRENLTATLDLIFREIKKAEGEGYDLVVLPESVFPMYLNLHPAILNSLKRASKSISIVTGSLLREGNSSYNASYLFENGNYQIAKKLVLVPFGEYIPLPKFAQDFINNTFFKGESDFVTATTPTDFVIKGIRFRNAICYEATCQEIYEGDVTYLIAISNNAWFSPSIEPTLQHLLLKYYARKNGVTIYHAANSAGSGIIK